MPAGEQPLRLGILGHPLEHTLSPVLHEQLMRLSGRTGHYQIYDIPPEQLTAQLEVLCRTQGVHGLNVTIPYKVRLLHAMDRLSPEARLTGAINTIALDASGRRIGHNTDLTGFIRSLPELYRTRLPQSHACILGAGGAARAVLAGLLQQGIAHVTLAARSAQALDALRQQGEQIQAALGKNAAATQLHTHPLDEHLALHAVDLLVHTTPVGMWPHSTHSLLSHRQVETLPAHALVYDLIYRPEDTVLLQTARAHGYQTLGGLDMLIHQGIAAFEIWTQHPLPPETPDVVRPHLLAWLQTVPSA